jgi:outer membrane protein assembly factor BamB
MPVAAAVALLATLAAPPARAGTDWTNFGFDNQRTGYNPDETVLGAGNAGSLRLSWSADVGGPILTQPTVATGVATAGGPRRDLVYVGTLDGVVAALDRTTGKPVWRRQLASALTGCDNPARFGVVGTPTLDRSAHVLYLTAADGKLHALDEASGAERPGWPVTITTRPKIEFVYTSPLHLGGSLYVETASNGCDHGAYRGQSAKVDIASRKVVARFFPTGASGNAYGGAIWGEGGASAEPDGSAVYVLTGNAKHGKGIPENFGLADRIVRLTPALKVTASDYPGVAGAIQNEFGATPVLFPAAGVAGGCVAAMDKNGQLLTYRRAAIAAGPVGQLQLADFGNAEFGSFIGSPAYDPAHGLLVVDDPTDSNTGTYKHGAVALQVGAGCSLRLAWQRAVGRSVTGADNPSIPPTVANGVVYLVRSIESTVYAFDAASGRQLWSTGSGIKGGVFASPTVANGQLLVAGFDGRLRAFGP